MAKKWTVAEGAPLKARLVRETESERENECVKDKHIRVRTIGKRIVRMLLALWVMSIGAWLQMNNHGDAGNTGDTDEPQDAIGGQNDPFRGI